ncbi:MAG: PEP-CTERM sorting domain-containing protein [Deltaproteobacteria bacterium]|jgi:hypothetical protein|nr:PEP-CTERM sorting domain-containing protein [Deltaproteobacteria bacterium]
MKKNAIILFTLSLVFLMAGIGQAAPYYGPIVMVEADPGPAFDVPIEMNVTCTVKSLDAAWTAGEWTGAGFTPYADTDLITPGTQAQVTWLAGTVVDFALQQIAVPANVLKLSDGIHPVNFQNPNNLTGIVEAPNWVTTWYDDADIIWSGGPLLSLEIITTGGDPDGIAPVPIPSAIMLLGSGLVGLVGFRKKFRS